MTHAKSICFECRQHRYPQACNNTSTSRIHRRSHPCPFSIASAASQRFQMPRESPAASAFAQELPVPFSVNGWGRRYFSRNVSRFGLCCLRHELLVRSQKTCSCLHFILFPSYVPDEKFEAISSSGTRPTSATGGCSGAPEKLSIDCISSQIGRGTRRSVPP